jgi:hypothetical protein
MLIINDDLFKKDNIIKLTSDDQWTADDSSLLTKCALDSLKSLLLQTRNPKSVILLVDCEKGSLPSLKIGIEVAKKFMELKSTISEKVDFSIIYAKSESTKQWFNNILNVYTPARPLYFLEHKAQIKKALKLARLGGGLNHEQDILEQLSVLDNTVSVQN